MRGCHSDAGEKVSCGRSQVQDFSAASEDPRRTGDEQMSWLRCSGYRQQKMTLDLS